MSKCKSVFAKILIAVFLLSIPNSPLFNEKVSAENNTIGNSAANYEKSKEILVKYKDTSSLANNSTMRKMSISRVKHKKKLIQTGIEVLEVVDEYNIKDVLKELSESPEIEFAQPNYRLNKLEMTYDEFFENQWGLNNAGQVIQGQPGVVGVDIGVLSAWEFTNGSQDVIVGVIDSDIDVFHPDLMDNIYYNPGEIIGNYLDDDQNGYIDDITGWDFYNDDYRVYDLNIQEKHGTHVAGTIAASTNLVGIQGAAPGVKILPLKFIQGDEGGYTSDAIEAIEYAKIMGAKIVNCSWGGSDYNPALKKAMADSNMLFICAAGNSGSNSDVLPIFPANFDLPNVLSVAAIDNRGNLAKFSNYGNTVDIAAPGVEIFSTWPEENYGFGSGTSFAAPFVTGVAALLKSVKQNIEYAELISLINSNVKKLPALQGRVMTNGVVDAFGAVTALQAVQTHYGDVNDDEAVTAGDATLLLRYIVGLTSFTEDQKQAADVNGDGAITAGDATLVLRYVVGLILEFPIEK